MPKQDEERPIKEVIDEMIELLGMGDKMVETRLKTDWEEIAGKMIAKYTRSIRLHKNTLFIQLDSAAVKNEMLYLKEPLRVKINQHFGKELVEKVVF
ncbi:MAG: DUF721 domain-containing protein [Chitinophagales bacterium]